MAVGVGVRDSAADQDDQVVGFVAGATARGNALEDGALGAMAGAKVVPRTGRANRPRAGAAVRRLPGLLESCGVDSELVALGPT